MGNILRKRSKYSDEDIDKILERLDKDKDGKISKEEFNDWKNKELIDIINDKMRMNNEIDKLNKIIIELEKEIKYKDMIIKDINNIDTNKDTNNKEEIINNLSNEEIDKYIEGMMKKNNIPYLPDIVEKKIYRNVFNLLFEIIKSLSCDFVGHKLKLNLIPLNIL
jgi:Ca2+-binding EF-hand superfamily protein